MDEAAQDALLHSLLEWPHDALQLPPREQALVRYADRVTKAPSKTTRDDIEVMRAAGLDDRAIHDACAIIAYFAFVNRMADGLGVELEPE